MKLGRLSVALLAMVPFGAMAEGEVAEQPKDVPPLMGAEGWTPSRRSEIRKILSEEVYGVRPVERPDGLSFAVLDERKVYGGKAVRKLVRGGYRGPGGEATFDFALWLPATNRPVSAFVHLSPRPAATADDPNGPRPVYLLPAEYITGRGYAVAAVCDYDFAEDWTQGGENATGGVFKVFGPKNRDHRGDTSWGILSAWAWGASRVMDYLENEKSVDARRVGVVGLSRNGKTALIAGAFDERFAMTVSCCSGMCGAKLNHIYAEGSEQAKDILIAHRWFSPRFAQWSGRDREMPFDQHWLLALVAPRLLYVSSAREDNWAGQRGEFASCVLATPAWNACGVAGLVQRGFPATDVPLHSGNIGYHIRSGVHDITRVDWEHYLDFADGRGWNLAR